jgi:hypothetical protein
MKLQRAADDFWLARAKPKRVRSSGKQSLFGLTRSSHEKIYNVYNEFVTVKKNEIPTPPRLPGYKAGQSR